MHSRSLALALICGAIAVSPAWGQKKELIQLQRDMALMQDALRQSEQKTTERLVALEALMEQNSAKEDRLVAGQAVIERALAALDDKLTEPQRLTAAKVDSLTDQFANLQATVEEMGVLVDRLQRDTRDIKTHLTTLPGPLEGEGLEADASGVNASESIFEGGLSDYTRGNIDAARGQFMDYLALYPTHARAGEAQYYLAETFYSAADYEEAVRQFDLVYKKYPLSPQAADAEYKKGMAQEKLRSREEAEKTFESVIERFPNTSAAQLARAELNRLRNSKPSPGL